MFGFSIASVNQLNGVACTDDTPISKPTGGEFNGCWESALFLQRSHATAANVLVIVDHNVLWAILATLVIVEIVLETWRVCRQIRSLQPRC